MAKQKTPSRSIDTLIAKYKPKTTRNASGTRCLFELLGKDAEALAIGLRERAVTLDEIGRIIAEEFGVKTGVRGGSVSRHLGKKCRCFRG